MKLLRAYREIHKPTGWGHHDQIWNANGDTVRATFASVEAPVYHIVGNMWRILSEGVNNREQ